VTPILNASHVFWFRGDPVGSVRFAGVSVTAFVVPDPAEVERRADTGLGPILDHQLLVALSLLPHDHIVSDVDIDPVVHAILDNAPEGAVVRADGGVLRLWRPAIRLEAVLRVAPGTRWRPALQRVSLFAPDASRAVLVRGHVASKTELETRAQRLETGVAILEESGETHLLVPAVRNRRVRVTPRHWRLLETAYGRWLQTADQPMSSAQARR